MTILVSTGDPAGVGPAISLTAAARLCDRHAFALYGDADHLERAASEQGIATVRSLEPQPGAIGLVHVASWTRATIEAHAPSPAGGSAQLSALDRASADVKSGLGTALVTAPISKEAVALAGVDFTGHTEHLAIGAGLAPDAVTMIFIGRTLRVALVTTHLAVRDVPAAITEPRVVRTIVHLAQAIALERGGGRLAVTGLNPHAGESGLFGREEIEQIAPAVARARALEPLASGSVTVSGPVATETAFRAAQAGDLDGVVTMMHDQATIASKLLDFGHAVNVTWGLPYVRTSVDHGVAYDAARAGNAREESMLAAMELAVTLSARASRART
jgi:4-hydroxythreonine-4-phosphate dehydrogenase